MDFDFLRPTDTRTWHIASIWLYQRSPFVSTRLNNYYLSIQNLSISFICVHSFSLNSFYFILWMRVNFFLLFFIWTEPIIMQANRQISVFFVFSFFFSTQLFVRFCRLYSFKTHIQIPDPIHMHFFSICLSVFFSRAFNSFFLCFFFCVCCCCIGSFLLLLLILL